MHDSLSQTLTNWKLIILEIGLFILFVVTFGDFVIRKLFDIFGRWFR
jgi:hypothetical protein